MRGTQEAFTAAPTGGVSDIEQIRQERERLKAFYPDGYGTRIGEFGERLSGGEKQRIEIARAILKDAPIVLLDEATASVDPESENLIQDAINALIASKTLIIIAHRLSTIISADQIIVLNDHGEIEEMGKHEELLHANRLYKRFWESRQQARGWKVAS
jgi:ATP-binding cassette subfamily B protein